MFRSSSTDIQKLSGLAIKKFISQRGKFYQLFDAIQYVVRTDNLPLLQTIYSSTDKEIVTPDNLSIANTAIELKATKILKYLLNRYANDGLGEVLMVQQLTNDNLDGVKQLINSGVKVTAPMLKINTSKEIKSFISNQMWNN